MLLEAGSAEAAVVLCVFAHPKSHIPFLVASII